MLLEKGIDGLVVFLGGRMPGHVLHHGEVFRLAQRLVYRRHLLERLAGAVDVEDVVGRGDDQGGFGGSYHEQVRVVDAPADHAEKVLFAVPRTDFLQNSGQVGYVVLRGGRVNAVVEGRQILRLVAAARAARHADAGGVYFGPGEEVVHRPDAVPDHVARQRTARQEGGRGGIGVFAGSRAHPRIAVFRIGVL